MSMTLSDIQLPADLHKTMAVEANAVRNANANVINAEAELRSARSLKQAADIMNEAPITAKLRYLQTLGEISGPKTNVITYALPVELLQYAADYCTTEQPTSTVMLPIGLAPLPAPSNYAALQQSDVENTVL